MNASLFDLLFFQHAHCHRSLRPGVLQLLQLGFQVVQLVRLRLGEFAVRSRTRGRRFFQRHEHDRIGGDVARRALVGNDDVALPVLLEAVFAERHVTAVERGRFLHVDRGGFFAIDAEHGHRDFLRAVGAGGVGQSHFVPAGWDRLGVKRERFFTLRLVLIVQIPVADVTAGVLRFLPLADLRRQCVIDDDAGNILDGQHPDGAALRVGLRLLRFDLRLQRRDRGFVCLHRGFFERGQRQRDFNPGGDVGMLHRLHVAENPGEGVVIPRRNRVELVVVTSRTRHGLREEPFRHHVQLFVHDIHAKLLLILFFQVRVAQHQERGGHEVTRSLDGIVRGQQVAGNLLADELVERHVSVERINHVVAVPPRLLEDEAA